MAVIERIRKRSGLLIAIIGIALLAFILQDLFRSTGSRRSQKLMVVNGKELSYEDFSRKVDERRLNRSLTSEQEIQLKNQILEEMIWDQIMTKEFDAVGMTVSEDELRDQFLADQPNPLVAQQFSDADGNYNREALLYTLQMLENASDQDRQAWVNFENAIKEDRLKTKFSNLVKASYYVPQRLAQKYYDNRETKVTVELVGLLHTAIADSLVTVTDQDYKNYYELNKYKYDKPEHRSIEYVAFEVGPSQLDNEETKQNVASLKESFTKTENVVGFLKNNRSELAYDSTWLGRPDVPADAEEMLFSPETEVGFVYGPYYEAKDNSYRLLRLVDRDVIDDSLMVRVAVLSKTPTAGSRTDQEVKAKANQFLAENNTQEKFNAAIESEGLTKGVQSEVYPFSVGISGLNSSRGIVNWAFNEAKNEGEMKLFEFDDKYVVARLTHIVPEGYVPMENLVEQFKNPVLIKKKAEKAAELMKSYGSNYDLMVKELGAKIDTVNGISIESDYIGRFGDGPEVIAAIMAMKDGEVLGPIAGNQSGFIIKKVTPETSANSFDYNAIATEKKSQFDNRVKGQNYRELNALGGVYEALRKNAKIKDNRTKFF